MFARALALLLLGIFAWSSRSYAAEVDIYVTRQGASQDWELRVDSLSEQAIGKVAVVVSDSLASFTPSAVLFIASFCASCAPPGSGLRSFEVFEPSNFPMPWNILVGPFQSRVLGVFHSSTSDPPQVLPGGAASLWTINGGTISDFAIHVVPEPGVSELALLGLLGVNLVRRTRIRSATRT